MNDWIVSAIIGCVGVAAWTLLGRSSERTARLDYHFLDPVGATALRATHAHVFTALDDALALIRSSMPRLSAGALARTSEQARQEMLRCPPGLQTYFTVTVS